MKINVKTEVRCYSVDAEPEGTYRAVVGELTNQPAVEKIIAKLLSEKSGRERSIKSEQETIDKYAKPETPLQVKIRETYSGLIEFDKSHIAEIERELETYQGELNLKTGEVIDLEGFIESGMPLNLADFNGGKITTRPVTYVKIE